MEQNRFLSDNAATSNRLSPLPHARNTLSAVPLARKSRGFDAIVATLSPVAQKGAQKICSERLEIMARRNALLKRALENPGSPRPTALDDLEAALGQNTSALRRVVGAGVMPHVLAALDDPEIQQHLLDGVPQEEAVRASPPRGSSPDDAARLWRRRILDVHHGPTTMMAAVDHNSPDRFGNTDLRNRLAKAQADPTEGLSYYQRQQLRLGRSRRGSTSIAGAWEQVWTDDAAPPGAGAGVGGGAHGREQQRQGAQGMESYADAVGISFEQYDGPDVRHSAAEASGEVDLAAVEALLQSMQEVGVGMGMGMGTGVGEGGDAWTGIVAQVAPQTAAQPAGVSSLQSSMLQRLQSSIDSVAPARPGVAPAPAVQPQPMPQRQQQQHQQQTIREAPVAPPPPPPSHYAAPPQPTSPARSTVSYAPDTGRGSGHAPYNGLDQVYYGGGGGGGGGGDDARSVRTMGTTASRLLSRGAKQASSAGLLPLPRDTLSARRMAASGHMGVLGQAFTALPRKTQIAARELALDVFHLHAKLAVLHNRVEQASTIGGRQAAQQPALLGEVEEALSTRLAQLISVAGEGLASTLLQELGKNPADVRAVLDLPEPEEREEDVDGAKTGIGGDATGLWRRRLGMRDVATVRKAQEPSSFVFSTLPADGILPDGSRSLFAKETGAGKQDPHKKEENVSYYQRAAARYGRARRGSTSIAGAWADIFASAEQQLDSQPGGLQGEGQGYEEMGEQEEAEQYAAPAAPPKQVTAPAAPPAQGPFASAYATPALPQGYAFAPSPAVSQSQSQVHSSASSVVSSSTAGYARPTVTAAARPSLVGNLITPSSLPSVEPVQDGGSGYAGGIGGANGYHYSNGFTNGSHAGPRAASPTRGAAAGETSVGSARAASYSLSSVTGGYAYGAGSSASSVVGGDGGSGGGGWAGGQGAPASVLSHGGASALGGGSVASTATGGSRVLSAAAQAAREAAARLAASSVAGGGAQASSAPSGYVYGRTPSRPSAASMGASGAAGAGQQGAGSVARPGGELDVDSMLASAEALLAELQR